MTHQNAATVVHLYEFFERAFTLCGCRDMTEGIYHGNPDVSYEEAQRNQLNYLLDEIGAKEGSRILDIGCGHGTLLEEAAKRGAIATGITISPAQVRYCSKRGLDVRLLNYRNIGEDWNGAFDGIVANGSMEHFVQPSDVLAGKADEMYREFFSICKRILKKGGRMATTVIHSARYAPSAELLQSNPFSHTLGSDEFHASYLQNAMGGSYPGPGQLKRCAGGFFEQTQEVDGTEDYRLTSEEWLRRVRKSLLRPLRLVRILARLTPLFLMHPIQSARVFGLLWSESWQWQFRGNPPPTQLLRHTWQAV